MSAIESYLAKARNLGSTYNNTADRLCTKAATRLPERYFKPFPWEQIGNGIIYSLAGVGIFRKLVCEKGNRGEGYALKFPTLTELLKYEIYTRRHEVNHTIQTLVGIAGITISSHFDNSLLMVGCGAWAVGNLYPTMLQRALRERVYRVLDRANKRKQ